jgi:RNA polymerase sigma-70 factor, ECF subfamily
VARARTAQEAAALMAQIAAGRETALAQLIALFAGDIVVFASRYLGNRADGEEVAQDTFLRVWRMAARYDPARAKVTTWIYRIAVNLCIDKHRRNRLWRFFGHQPAADLADTLADPAPATPDIVAGRQRLGIARKAIAALPDRQRMAIMLSAVAGLETKEIALAMGASDGAVEQLLVRARRTLRSDMGDEDENR